MQSLETWGTKLHRFQKYRDQTAILQSSRRKKSGVAGEHVPGVLTPPTPPDHIYRLPGTQPCNQFILTIPELAGIWPWSFPVSGEHRKTSKHNSLLYRPRWFMKLIRVYCKFHREYNTLYHNINLLQNKKPPNFN